MTKAKAKTRAKKEKEEVTWNPLDQDEFQGMAFSSADVANSCCGVLEIEGIQGKKISCRVVSKETHQVPFRDWSGVERFNEEPHERDATFPELVSAFKVFLDDKKRFYGIAVCYLLPVQHQGDFGKLLKATGWTLHGSFWNPKTKHTLYHYSKTLHHKARTKGRAKSLFVPS